MIMQVQAGALTSRELVKPAAASDLCGEMQSKIENFVFVPEHNSQVEVWGNQANPSRIQCATSGLAVVENDCWT